MYNILRLTCIYIYVICAVLLGDRLLLTTWINIKEFAQLIMLNVVSIQKWIFNKVKRWKRHCLKSCVAQQKPFVNCDIFSDSLPTIRSAVNKLAINYWQWIKNMKSKKSTCKRKCKQADKYYSICLRSNSKTPLVEQYLPGDFGIYYLMFLSL